MRDTIAAISTPLGAGGLGVIRISGPQARAVTARVFLPLGKKSVEKMTGYTCLYGHVKKNDEVLDEAVCTCFASPKSYTGEDVMELSCHGGAFLLEEILQAVIEAGARGAQPGEFTRRALENGKLSLTQAEAVMDLIGAQGQMAARAALAAREGALFQALEPIKNQLLQLNSHLSALIDFPEEDLPELSLSVLYQNLTDVRESLSHLLSQGKRGKILQKGISCAIVGRPNVGKSSLMNLLAGYRRSIVTPIPGTTRDVVEELVSLDGLVLRLMDTAGIRETQDLVELEGVSIAKQRIEEADLVLAVFDLSTPLASEDRQVLSLLERQGLTLTSETSVSHETFPAPVITIWNKSDLPCCLETEEMSRRLPGVVISAKEGKGAETLWEKIREMLRLNQLDPNAPLLANRRQEECAARALSQLEEALSALAEGWTLDAVSVGVEEALQALMELTGEKASQETIDQVFRQFCVGK